MPDEIMRRIDAGEPLYIFDPSECPDLVEAIGATFTEKYNAYIEQAERGEIKLWRKIDSREFYKKYLFKLAKTGHPWLTFKDAHNKFNPCPDYGVINSTNLCTEISIPNAPDSTAVCTLASVNLSRHIKADKSDIDWPKFADTLETIVGALDNILDHNFYPSPESKKNTHDLRPLGIGLMGFAEALVDLGVAYDSDAAVQMARKIGKFMRKTVYKKSEQLAQERGAFAHYDEQAQKGAPYHYKPRRNAVLLAIAPTASISIISGTTSTIDSYFSNIYSRDTLSGKFIVVNRQLMRMLEEKALWSDDIFNQIKAHNGSVQLIDAFDAKVDKELFKTAYEIHPNRQIEIAAAFQESVDQAVSKSIYIEENLRDHMQSIYTYAWKMGLKSTYYCFIDKTIKGEKYTSQVNKRGKRRGFSSLSPVNVTAAEKKEDKKDKVAAEAVKGEGGYGGRGGEEPNYASGHASPAAKKKMSEEGVSANQIKGTGKNGRITKQDVINAMAGGFATDAASGWGGTRDTERKKMSSLRRKVAERLVGVKNETAMLTTFNELNMKPIMDMRSKYKEVFKENHGVGLGFMSFFTKAVTEALNQFPAVNAQIDGKEMVMHHYADIGIAVSSPKGLMVPVVRNAEQMSLAEIESEIKRLAIKARDGKITIDEMQGGTFTITNGGVFGSMMSTPIINPPQSAILGMHNIVERPMAVNGEVKILPMMYLALSYDHRLIDGKESVSFLVAVKEMLENPERMIFGGKSPEEVLLGL